MAYFNTTNLSGETLVKEKKNAQTQEEIIMDIYKRFDLPYTPCQIQSNWMENAPLTSVRRAITSLEKQGKLIKLDTMVEGIYGKPVHLWRAR